jgi:hypothetical protein
MELTCCSEKKTNLTWMKKCKDYFIKIGNYTCFSPTEEFNFSKFERSVILLRFMIYNVLHPAQYFFHLYEDATAADE